ncbi:phospholipase D-like domain-containing protein [Parasphingopyxis marina]|uniref:Phospholipase D n=1 Tax=Parasphingopyxis marina TaxID=2761622 RepID=A0A842HV79_9SPHN|nr:phosphatidylserine/phosphatidylglycerophosphate/cardiolipin synthase family protein [Parasphingopyxis marina]MBC2776815.1 phosphatidylserine/phosphatidylglycerophosphate/cardiolipin synthase family protein [Parasphingopyxis marina]
MADIDTPEYGLPGVAGHEFRLLAEGPERLEALVELIESAERSIRLLYYIFLEDEAATRVRDALVEAHKRGVTVSLLVDGFGSDKASDEFFRPINETGCFFCRYEPKRTRRYLLRNHQKMAIADEARALLGGFNVEKGYFAAYRDESGWRDLGIAVAGPLVPRLADYFDALTRWSENPKSEMEDLRAILHSCHEQDGDVRLLFGGPTRELSPWAQTIRNDLYGAKRIDVIAAYFAPYAALLRPFRQTAKNGRTRVITASKTDNNVTIAAARNRFQYLLPEVEIYEYQPMKLHTKLYVIDDITYIGSANFDVRSLYLNLEIMLRIKDRGFADVMRRFVDHEVADSERITPEAYAESRTIFNRIRGRLSYFTMSVLDYNVSRRLNFGLDGQ